MASIAQRRSAVQVLTKKTSSSASPMRRGPVGAIIFGLALLMQLLAPALAAQSMAGSGDHIAICFDAGSSTDNADGSDSGGTPAHHQHCGFCQLACAAGLLEFLSVWISIAPPAERGVATWAIEPERKARFGLDQHEVPRGPPSLA